MLAPTQIEKDYLIKLGEILKIEKEQKTIIITLEEDLELYHRLYYTGKLASIVLDRADEPNQRLTLVDAANPDLTVGVFYLKQIDTISIVTHF